jgi:signal transduction histidine kinase
MGLVSVDIESQIQTNQLLLNRVFLLLAGLLTGTLATGVFYLITSRLILQPVRVLQDTAEKVSEGDLNIRCDISSNDEFQQLSETINQMLANLKEGEDQLRAINKSLDMKLGQLEESNVALYESNRLKNEFLANVSHELRTPLSHIKGYTETLLGGAKDDPDVATRFLQTIARNAERLQLLIEDLLTISELESGRVTLNLQPLSLHAVVEKVFDDFKARAEARTMTLTDKTAGVKANADAVRLEQVLSNLVDNAIKYGRSGGRVTIGARSAGDGKVEVCVQDDGPGLPADSLERVFERFYRVDKGRSREQGGTGLGLAIVKHIVQSHGGAVWAKSEAGRGATFYFTLAIAP